MKVKICGECPFWHGPTAAEAIRSGQLGNAALKRTGTCFGSVPDTHLAPGNTPGSLQIVNARPSCNFDDHACSIPNLLPSSKILN